MELTLVRHPPPDIARGVCYGALDVPCAPGWEIHAERLIADLRRPDALYSSPASRCRVLAERLGEQWGIDAQYDSRLLELDFGQWEGRRWDQIDRRESDPWAQDPIRIAPPGGESYAALLGRVRALLADVEARHGRVTLITHGGPIRAVIAHLLAIAPEAALSFPVEFGGVTRLKRERSEWTVRETPIEHRARR